MSDENDMHSGRRAVVRVPERVRAAGHGTRHYDNIGCAEPTALLFDRVLVPAEMWCSTDDCIDAFGNVFEVHTIDCDADACDVRLHCARELGAIQYAAALTFIGALILLAFALFGRRRTAKTAFGTFSLRSHLFTPVDAHKRTE